MLSARRLVTFILQQLCGKMTGHWELDSNLCRPYIGKYEDHGVGVQYLLAYRMLSNNYSAFDTELGYALPMLPIIDT